MQRMTIVGTDGVRRIYRVSPRGDFDPDAVERAHAAATRYQLRLPAPRPTECPLVADYNTGLRVNDVSRKRGVCPSTVKSALARARQAGFFVREPTMRRPLSGADAAILAAYNAGATYTETADAHDVPRHRVGIVVRRARELGLHARTREKGEDDAAARAARAARDARIAALEREGFSPRAIAGKLGVSRNTVHGAAWRMRGRKPMTTKPPQTEVNT